MAGILNLDTEFFIFFNSGIQNPVFDFLMPIVTNIRYWRIPLALLALAFLIWGGRRGRLLVLFLVVGIAISDQLSSLVLKNIFERTRPCHVLPEVRLLMKCLNSYSFPSSHAVNTFAGAVIFTYFYRKTAWIFFPVAVLSSFSRVYMGVHYPLDLFAGAVLGSSVALLLIYVGKKFLVKYKLWLKDPHPYFKLGI